MQLINKKADYYLLGYEGILILPLIVISFLAPAQRYLAASVSFLIIIIPFILIQFSLKDYTDFKKYFFASIALAGISIEIFRTSIAEFLIWIVFINAMRTKTFRQTKVPSIIKVLFLTFIFTSMITMLFQKYESSLETWRVSTILPMVIFKLVFYYVENIEDIERILTQVTKATLLFLMITLLARLNGFAPDNLRLYVYQSYDQLSLDVAWGAFVYPFWSNLVAVLLVLGTTVVFSQYLNSIRLKKLFYGISFLVFIYVEYLLKGRAAIGGLIVGIIVIVFLSFRENKKLNFFKNALIIISILVILFFSMNFFITEFTYNRFAAIIWGNGFYSGSGLYRIELINNALIDNGIIGIGFGTLWGLYRIDDATLYTWLLNGSGYVGFLGIIGLFLYLSWIFFKNSLTKKSNYLKYYIIGLSSLIAILIASYADNAIMNYTFCVIPFWTIMATVLKASIIENNT